MQGMVHAKSSVGLALIALPAYPEGQPGSRRIHQDRKVKKTYPGRQKLQMTRT
jgi:hypothetical protein